MVEHDYVRETVDVSASNGKGVRMGACEFARAEKAMGGAVYGVSLAKFIDHYNATPIE